MSRSTRPTRLPSASFIGTHLSVFAVRASIIAGSMLIAIAIFVVPVTIQAEDDAYDPSTLVYPPFRHCLGIHKATNVHLFLYLGTRTKFNEPTDLAAVKLMVKDDPATAEDDDELTVFGLNSGECEIIYNTSLANVEIFGECGGGRGQFSRPLGIAADENGNVLVADTGNDRIVRLRYENDQLVFVNAFGSTGSGPGQLSAPSQIALSASQTVYIADTGNDRVLMLAGDGRPLREIAGDTEAGVTLDGPFGLAVLEAADDWTATTSEFLVVADRAGRRLTKFSLDGRLLAVTEAGELPIEGAEFRYLAVDYYANIYATDTESSRIHKFDRELRYVTSIGRPGDGDMELDEPRGITIWRRFGQLFVTEREGAQYFWIGTEIQNLAVAPSPYAPRSGALRISYFLTETARVTIDLVDSQGNVVHTLVDDRRRSIGENVEHWDGLRGRGTEPVPPGDYELRIAAVPTYSSRKYFRDVETIPVQLLPAGAPRRKTG